MATDDTIAMFKREDAKLEEALQYVVPIKHGVNTNLWGPAVYKDKGEPEAWEKANYLKMLAPQAELKPTIEITKEDIDVLKSKAYTQTEYDFNNYVGELIKPDASPANKAFLQKIYPAWFDKQKKAIETWHDTKKKVESLLITGPKNQEDLFMLYRLGYDPQRGIGSDNTHQMGRFQPLVTQLQQAPPGLNWTAQSVADTVQNFQRGLFNQDRKQLISQAMMGFRGSVFAGQENERGDAEPVDTNALKTAIQPFGTGYPKPAFWNHIANTNEYWNRLPQ